jgi:hypothetical protein
LTISGMSLYSLMSSYSLKYSSITRRTRLNLAESSSAPASERCARTLEWIPAYFRQRELIAWPIPHWQRALCRRIGTFLSDQHWSDVK